MRAPLRLQLALASSLLVAFSILAIGWMVLGQVRESVTEEVQLRGLAVARHLAGVSSDFLLSGDDADRLALANLSQGARENKDVAYVKIVDSRGVVKSAAPSQGVEGLYFPPAGLEGLEGRGQLVQRYYSGRQWIQDVLVPIRVGERQVGFINLGLDESSVEAAVFKARIKVVQAGALVMCCALVVALLSAVAISRPVERLGKAVRSLGEGVMDTRVQVGGPRELRELEERFNLMASKLQGLVHGVIQSLATALAEHDQVSPGHAERVARHSVRTARVLKQDARQLEEIRLAAQLIDIGHMGLPSGLLHKVEPLSDEELRKLRTHPQVGARIIEPLSPLKPVLPMLIHHHERWDGRGYPLGLKGEAIPMGARILAVADAFDAMLTERRHRKARSQNDAMRELQRCAGAQFDPKIVDAFITQLTAAA